VKAHITSKRVSMNQKQVNAKTRAALNQHVKELTPHTLDASG